MTGHDDVMLIGEAIGLRTVASSSRGLGKLYAAA